MSNPPDLENPDATSYSADLRNVAESWFIGRTFTFENYSQTRIYAVPEHRLIQTLPLPHSFGTNGVSTYWSPDNTRIAIAMDLESLQIWEVNSSFQAGGVAEGVNLLWSPRGDRLALNQWKALWIFGPEHQGEIPLFVDPSNNPTIGGALVWSPDGTRLAQVSPLSIWDVETNRRLPTPFTDPSRDSRRINYPR